MLIITSPTKQMKINTTSKPISVPCFQDKSSYLLNHLQSLTFGEIKQIMRTNDTITQETTRRFQEIKFDLEGSCAIQTYCGLQFQYMQIEEAIQFAYLQRHLRILSGFYGLLKPYDSIYPYRLEMQARIALDGGKDLYTYWNTQIAQALDDELSSHEVPVLLNVASKEYEKACISYMNSKVITLTFKIRKQDKLKTESTQVKMARGRMIHYLSMNQVNTLDQVRSFHEDGYQFMEELSTEQEYVFVKEIL